MNSRPQVPFISFSKLISNSENNKLQNISQAIRVGFRCVRMGPRLEWGSRGVRVGVIYMKSG